MQEEEHTDDSNDTNSILQSSIDAMISTTFKDLPPSSPESDGKFSGAGASETYEVPEASVNPPGSDDA